METIAELFTRYTRGEEMTAQELSTLVAEKGFWILDLIHEEQELQETGTLHIAGENAISTRLTA